MDSQHISSSESCLERDVHSGAQSHVLIRPFPIAGILLSSHVTLGSIVEARAWLDVGLFEIPSYMCSVAGVDAAFINTIS